MDIHQIIIAAGGPAKLARLLSCHHSSVLGWRRVPSSRVAAVSAITGIPPAVLRPDLAQIFAEPATTEPAAA